MSPDPIVEEVRVIRDQIAKECGYDIDTIFQRLRSVEAAGPARHVSLSPRRTPEPEHDGSSPAHGAA
jgi:hypothetical protein